MYQDKLSMCLVRRTAVSGGALSGMASTVVEFHQPEVADAQVSDPGSRQNGISVHTPKLMLVPDIVAAVSASTVSRDDSVSVAPIGVLVLRLSRLKGIRQTIIELLSYSTLPHFRVLLIEAPENVSVNADFMRTLRNAVPSCRHIAWTTICSAKGTLNLGHVLPRNIASFSRHGFLHTLKFLSSGADSEFEFITDCVSALNTAYAHSDSWPFDPMTVYVAPETPYDSYVATSVQYRCLRYGYSYAPM